MVIRRMCTKTRVIKKSAFLLEGLMIDVPFIMPDPALSGGNN